MDSLVQSNYLVANISTFSKGNCSKNSKTYFEITAKPYIYPYRQYQKKYIFFTLIYLYLCLEEVPIWKLEKVYKRAKSVERVCCLMIKLHKHPKVYASFCTKNCCLDKLCEWHRTNTCLGCSFKFSSVSYKLFLLLDFKHLKFDINPP